MNECPSLKTPLRAMMTASVITVARDASARDTAQLFLDRGISGAPVVDEHGRAIGLVSKTDLLRSLHGDGQGGALVDAIMMPLAFSLPESATLGQAAALMAYEGFHRITVVDDSGKIVGLVSALDVLRCLARSDGFVIPDMSQLKRVSDRDDS